MKKFISCVVFTVMMMSLAACGGKEQSAAYTMEVELEGGVVMTDTLTLDARGDRVQQITEEVKLDMTGVNEERRTELVAQYDAIAERYQAVDGVECTVDNTDGVYSMTVVIDVKDDVISQLSEQNLLTINGGASEISLEKSGTSLVESGYTLVEDQSSET